MLPFLHERFHCFHLGLLAAWQLLCKVRWTDAFSFFLACTKLADKWPQFVTRGSWGP